MSRLLGRLFGVLVVFAMIISLCPTVVWAQAPMGPAVQSDAGNEDRVPRSGVTRVPKPLDAPNPFEYRRLTQREQLLAQGRIAEAAALAKTGKDRILVILVEFAGTDIATWNPGDIWDPIADPSPTDYDSAGDCTHVVTTTQVFTYTGPLHNQMPRPTSVQDRAYDTIWTDDFGRQHYQDLLFGDGVYIQYSTADGEKVTLDLRGYSMRRYFEEQSKGLYTVDGDVIGWVQVPHSSAWYGADACPGARSAGLSWLADGFFPDGGDPRSLVRDAIDACVAAYPHFDWSQYDQDGDGVLDHVMVVHAGYGEEDSPVLLTSSGVGEMAIWSHSWTVWPFHPIGSTGLSIGPYTMQAENGTVGLFAHEFCHNIGAIDLYAYTGGETSPGFWTIMADDWGGGWPDSAVPPGLDPWHKYLLGWNDPVVLNTLSPKTEVVLGQASRPPAGTQDSVIISLPPQLEQPVSPANGHYMWWSGKTNYLDSKLTLSRPLDLSGATDVALQFKTFYDIEEGWDFGFVQVSTDAGATWTSVPGTTTTTEHDPDCFFVDELPGYTGFSEGWLHETADLSAYAGQAKVWIRFRYETDPATVGLGWYVDDIQVIVDGSTVRQDTAEQADGQWIVEGWTRTDGFAVYPHYYIAEWRNASGFDAGLASGRYNVKDFGMLLWYRNMRYSNNEIMDYLVDGPAFGPKGACLLIDAHFEPWRSSTSTYVNEVANLNSRLQMRDAAFGLRATEPFRVVSRLRNDNPDEVFPSVPAVPSFHDSLGWYPGFENVIRGPGDPLLQWFTKQWDSSAVIPAKGDYGVAPPDYAQDEPLRFGGEPVPDGRSAWYYFPAGVGSGGTTGNPGEKNYGVHIQVCEEALDLSWGKVSVWNDTETLISSLYVDKQEAGPGDVLTYELNLKDAASVPTVAVLEIPIPKGTTFIQGSLQGAQFVRDTAHPELADRGRVVWGGRVGGQTLHLPDAHIIFQVRVDQGAAGAIACTAVLTLKGQSHELRADTQLPSLDVVIAAPSFVSTRAPLRYKIHVTNGSSVMTLTELKVNASWTGGAYLVAPFKSAWDIPTLAPGATWTQELTMFTFSTASGEVVLTVKASHPSLQPASAQARTTIVR